MAGSVKAAKLGKRPDVSGGQTSYGGKLKTTVSANGGSAGSASYRKSAYSVSGGGMKTAKGKKK